MEDRERQKETDRQMKENAEQLDRQLKETDRQMKENAEQLDRQLKEIAERTAREMKKSARQLGKLGGRFGEMVEYMVAPDLFKKFRKLGFVFNKVYQQAKIKDENDRTIAEVDITLENGDKVMYVEVKSKPTTEDITHHVKRIEKIRAHADAHNDQRKFLGAIAGMVFNDNEKEFAMKNGFYVIEPSGKTFIITTPEGEYSPREWKPNKSAALSGVNQINIACYRAK